MFQQQQRNSHPSPVEVARGGASRASDPWGFPSECGSNTLMTYYTASLPPSDPPIVDFSGQFAGDAASSLQPCSGFNPSPVTTLIGGDPPREDPKSAYGRNIYVASLPADITDERLRALFEPFGKILSAKTMSRKNGACCSGYGFVLFERSADAARAQMAMIGHIVDGNRIQVRQARPSACQQILNVTASSRTSKLPPKNTQMLSAPVAAAVVPSACPVPPGNCSPQYIAVSPTFSVDTASSPHVPPLSPLPQLPLIVPQPQPQPLVCFMLPMPVTSNFW
ncbi:RNA-binding protein 5-like protein [Trypanosoma rangeli]|uniref:RNA-binding protein 5-like protein n=1 Tax=Trypanosoma rangeli TaxID=5698 RepID=A0A3R7KYA8_TRYRA|nr:RNA-binding protein 5-like protein [Trypanosoma rangeli]RNF03750.1 RNA-binding protein 5-like protein [Trypanosoma rangeli]|eukprot:RNF03750.1 RNA-binding protein 5-like protein [Trypanosoma rangeli]